jgi:hypothetical protein
MKWKANIMQQIITKETVDAAVAGVKGMSELAKQGATTLTDETIKLYIFYGIVGILKAAVAFIVFGIVWKYLDVLTKSETLKEGHAKAFKTSALIISIVYFTAMSMPHVLDLGKALVAPNLFLVEKGIALVNGK